MNSREQQLQAFDRLLTIMDELREQCPWDRKQTWESLRHFTIEETYELGDAILDRNLEEIKKELGDLLLHIVFYAKIGSEEKAFDIADVANAVCDKLIVRHPHIYGDVKAETDEDVKKNWEKIKLKEGRKSVLEGVPRSLPAMVKASRIQDKVAGVGFDWDSIDGVFDKVKEEIEELHKEVKDQNLSNIEAELGDVFFSLINYARFLKVNPEDALERTNKKFIQRFQYLERTAEAKGKALKDMTLAEMEQYWQEAKAIPHLH